MLSSEWSPGKGFLPWIEVFKSYGGTHGTQWGPMGLYLMKRGVVATLAPPGRDQTNQRLVTSVPDPFSASYTAREV